MTWARGIFRTKVRGELGPEWRPVRGYSNGTFGLDRRRYLDDDTMNFAFGYCVTHLPTGYAVRYVRGTLPVAKAFASALSDADWSFDDPAVVNLDGSRKRVVVAACEQFVTSNGIGFDPPASAMSAGTAETPQNGSGRQPASAVRDSADAQNIPGEHS